MSGIEMTSEAARTAAAARLQTEALLLATAGAANRDAVRQLKAFNIKLPVHFLQREIEEVWKMAKDGCNAGVIEQAGPGPRMVADARPVAPQGITAEELMALELPGVIFVVARILPVGATLLAAPPKTGKSWAALGLALAVAGGGFAFGSTQYRAAQGPVIYLALEDGLRRLRKRLSQLLRGEPAPPDFHFFTRWPKLDAGGLTALRERVEALSPKLVVLDTLARLRPVRTRNDDPYGNDSTDIAALKGLADEFNLALLIVHHTRKMGSLDVFATISGTFGLSGAADSLWVLRRGRGVADAVLNLTGKDIEEIELALEFQKSTGMWKALGDAREYAVTCEQRAVLDALCDAGKPVGLRDIARAVEKSESSVSNILNRLMDAGLVRRIGRGRYEPIRQETEDEERE